MTPLSRRIAIGAAAGLVSSYPLSVTDAAPHVSMAAGAIVGALFAAGLGSVRNVHAEGAMAACAFAVPLWILVTCLGLPAITGQHASLTAESMQTLFPALAGWTLYGCLLGFLTQAFGGFTDDPRDGGSGRTKAVLEPPKRILILGGGFAGMTAAVGLEEDLRSGPHVSVTLVSEQNALLFTPMLAEVAGGSLEPGHISTPLRTALHETEFVRGRAERVDFEHRRVWVSPAGGSPGAALEIPYDHLVLAVGAVSNYFGAANLKEHAMDFKTLLDASRIRNHVIEMFERADREHDVEMRRAQVTFVVAGGGFAGVELAGSINDFARGISVDYPAVPASDIRVVLVHSRDRILPELGEKLARYAQERMSARGVEFRLNTRLLDAAPGLVTLGDGTIRAQTLVWTAGTAPHPLVKATGIETDKRGAALVETTMAVVGHPGVWALGDCAAVKDGVNGKWCPPTAQFALRQGRAVARNIARSLRGEAPRPFHFDSLGSLCVVGHQTACAEITLPFARDRSVRFSGLLAWLMWRGIYVSKLPGLERKARVVVNWTFEIFFPRDIVQTADSK
jgi:NADH dehydrogenase